MRSALELKWVLADEEAPWGKSDHELRERVLKEAESLPDTPALGKMMAFLRSYTAEFTPFVRGDLAFAGTPGYFRLTRREDGLAFDIGHFCADYRKMVDIGIEGIRAQLDRAVPVDDEGRETKAAFSETLDLFAEFVRAHARRAADLAATAADPDERANLALLADDLDCISAHPPRTFRQGLQLILLQHCYVLLKPHTDTITFGNLDRVLWRLYDAEIKAGTLTREDALELICQFFLSFVVMDRDTQNIVLGGSDEGGGCFENELTLLFLEAQKKMHIEEPVVSLKIRPDTSDRVWDAALDVLANGGGMPSFLNDTVYREALRRFGFEEADLNTFANIGCYEAVPYGATFGGTVGGPVNIVPRLSRFFTEGTEDYPDFESFLAGWEGFLEREFRDVVVPCFAAKKENIYNNSASPFLGLIMDGCIESLRLPEHYGSKYNIFTVQFDGIGTLTDSLLCVKHFVYDTREVALEDYRRAVAENFPDDEFLAKIRAYPARFGSGDEESEKLAGREARFMSDLTARYPVNGHVKSTPALMLFTADIYSAGVPATPDGRRVGDRFSYGAAASELLPHRDTTKVLLATASLPLELFPIGAPMMVNLMGDILKTGKGRAAVRSMVETYLREGGTHIQFNIADPDVLRDAQAHPEKYKDLLIRISGHTEPFIRLNKTLQDALIERSAMGC